MAIVCMYTDLTQQQAISQCASACLQMQGAFSKAQAANAELCQQEQLQKQSSPGKSSLRSTLVSLSYHIVAAQAIQSQIDCTNVTPGKSLCCASKTLYGKPEFRQTAKNQVLILSEVTAV